MDGTETLSGPKGGLQSKLGQGPPNAIARGLRILPGQRNLQRQDGGVILIRLNTAQRLALNLDSHIVIDAGAGTGKTSTIVDRVIEHYLATDQRATRLLPKPTRPSSTGGGMVTAPASERVNLEEWDGLLPGEVVLLTFTNRAADEMKDRLRSAISRIRPGPLGDDGKHRFDPRVKSQGFVEQLLTPPGGRANRNHRLFPIPVGFPIPGKARRLTEPRECCGGIKGDIDRHRTQDHLETR